jgi:cytochrome c
MVSSRRTRWMFPVAVVAALLLLLPVVLAACGDNAITGSDLTKDDLIAFVDEAKEYAEKNGKEAAFQAFTQAGGEFHQGELYIFAYDFQGNVLAHGGDATLVGKNLFDLQDPTGRYLVREAIALAEQGSGWWTFDWPNPAHNKQVEPKLGYVEKFDDTWWLGSGLYGSAATGK